MSEPKTKITDANVEDFIGSVENERRRQDSFGAAKEKYAQ